MINTDLRPMRFLMKPERDFLWLYSLLAQGLSRLANIKALRFTADFSGYELVTMQPDLLRGPGPFWELAPVITSLSALHTFEFSTLISWRPPPDLDHVWECMKAAGKKLSSITVSAVSRALLEFLVSFGGLQKLILSPTRQGARYLSTEEKEELAHYMFNQVLPKHTKTLQHLALPCFERDLGRGWSLESRPMGSWCRFESLMWLTSPFCTISSELDDNQLELLVRWNARNFISLHSQKFYQSDIIEHSRSFPALIHLHLILTYTIGPGPETKKEQSHRNVHQLLPSMSFDDPTALPATVELGRPAKSIGKSDVVIYKLAKSDDSFPHGEWKYKVNESTIMESRTE